MRVRSEHGSSVVYVVCVPKLAIYTRTPRDVFVGPCVIQQTMTTSPIKSICPRRRRRTTSDVVYEKYDDFTTGLTIPGFRYGYAG